MKWLKKILGLGGLDTEAVMGHSLQLLKAGQPVEAISQMQAAVQAVKESTGNPSCAYAKGLFNLAMLHIAAGDMASGAEDCRLAAESCPDSAAGRKDRLTYLMNAGQLLSRAGRSDAAIEVLETSLNERIELYGPDHAGTAYGQQALADVYLSAGRFSEGLELGEKSLETFFHENHHEYPSALATTTALASAIGLSDHEVWEYAPSNDGEVVKPLIQSAMLLVPTMPDKSGLRYLHQLYDWAKNYLPADSPPLMNILALWSNLAIECGDGQERQLATAKAVETARLMDDPAVLVNALEGRALMLSDIGAPAEEVRTAYEEVLQLAKTHELTSDAAGVQRNWALFEAEAGFVEKANQQFVSALNDAQLSGDNEMLARTQIAYGIFHQHHQQNSQAVPLLESGIANLDPLHPDAACAVLHQVALAENLACPCSGDTAIAKEAIGQLAQRFFAKSGLDDIIESVAYGDDEQAGLKVELSREPSPQEMQRLQIAHGVFQNLLSRGTGHQG
jgi:tetratricopeptide (TPR) repeat protein